jgi:hypothetical protein
VSCSNLPPPATHSDSGPRSRYPRYFAWRCRFVRSENYEFQKSLGKAIRQPVVTGRDSWSCSLAFVFFERSVLRHKHRLSQQRGPQPVQTHIGGTETERFVDQPPVKHAPEVDPQWKTPSRKQVNRLAVGGAMSHCEGEVMSGTDSVSPLLCLRANLDVIRESKRARGKVVYLEYRQREQG